LLGLFVAVLLQARIRSVVVLSMLSIVMIPMSNTVAQKDLANFATSVTMPVAMVKSFFFC